MEDIRKLKFVIIGDKGVGKRTMLSTGFGKPSRLSSFYLPIEFNQVELRTNTKNYTITCFDSLVSASSVGRSEAPLVESFTATAINGADAILLCYAANNPDSFRSLAQWYREISVYLTPNTTIYLVKTKNDLASSYSDSNPSDLKIHFTDIFQISGLRKDDIVQMFGRIIERVEDPNFWTKSQTIGKTEKTYVTESQMKESYASPEKKSPTKREVRYSDKKEKIVLMEGSYVKRLTVVDESKPGMERSVRLAQKNLNDDANLDRAEEI
jgi:GTPase SAR1 family protein